MTAFTVLVADDEPEMLTLIQGTLSYAGHTVLAAENGMKAAKLLAAGGVHVVVTDVCMPERDGLEFIPEIRAKYPGVKIIAMSGGGHAPMGGYLHIAKQFGAHRIMSKPFRQSDLLTAIEEVMGAVAPGPSVAV